MFLFFFCLNTLFLIFSLLFYNACLCVNGNNNNEPLVRPTYKRSEGKRRDIHITLLSLRQQKRARRLHTHTHVRNAHLDVRRRHSMSTFRTLSRLETNDFDRIETPPSSSTSKDSTDESIGFGSHLRRQPTINFDFDKVRRVRIDIDDKTSVSLVCVFFSLHSTSDKIDR